MGDPAPAFWRGVINEPGHLCFRIYIPQAEFDLEPPVIEQLDISLNHGLGVDHPPVTKTRAHLKRNRSLDKGIGINRPEKTRAFQIRRDHRRNIATDPLGLARVPLEIGHRDRQGINIALGNIDFKFRLGRRGETQQQDGGKQAADRLETDHLATRDIK